MLWSPSPSIGSFFDDPFCEDNLRQLCSTPSPIWEVGAVFPRLHSLRFTGQRALSCRNLSCLPDTITKLRVQLPVLTSEPVDLAALPRGLLDLHISGRGGQSEWSHADLVDLPPNLTRLKTDRPLETWSAMLTLLPRSLNIFPEGHLTLTKSLAECLPPGTQSLDIEDVEHPISGHWTSKLPLSLVILSLSSQITLSAESLRLLALRSSPPTRPAPPL